MGPEAAAEVKAKKRPLLKRWQWAAVAVIVMGIGALAIWNFYLRPSPPSFEPASVEKMAYPLPDKPSIAVLPFENMSEDPKQEFFSDGMTEEIITALSKVPYMLVIARNSAFSYKGKPVKISQVAEELGVRYVLEGSFRKAGDKVRVTAQLIDAIKGHHLWAERYERELKDIFALQDEITMKILGALEVKLTEGEQASTRRKVTDNLEAYLKALQAIEYLDRGNKESNLLARQMAEEAMALDPEYARPYRILAYCHIGDIMLGTSKSPKKSMKQAFEMAQKAISLDESHPCGYEVLARIYIMMRQHDRAIAEAERAIALDPNGADAHATLGLILTLASRQQEAIAPLEKAIRINPIAPPNYFRYLGAAYRDTGRYEEAIAQFKKAINLSPDSRFAHLGLAATYSLAGRDQEARAEASEVLRIQPKFTLERRAKRRFYKNEADTDRLIGAYRKAGLPEKPPLPLPDKPSIAVLPFTNMSDDPKQEYFVDGMTDDLITDLSKISGLFVIARNSVFTYKGKSVKVEQIGRELGVRYILEGSVRRADKQVRINAQLIDAKTGGHLWAERYDGKMDDIFALQDKITEKIVTALAVKLTASEKDQITRKDTDNIEAYDAFLKGWGHYLRWARDDFRKAIFYFKKAIELDPNYGRAYAGLGNIYWFAPGGWLDIVWDQARNLALNYLQLAMKNPNASAHGLASQINLFLRLHKEAISEAERGLALAPNDPYMHGIMARVLNYAGRPKEAIEFAEFEMRHDPRQIHLSLYLLGLAHFSMGKLEQAATYFERSFKHNPEYYHVLRYLAPTYAHLGRNQEARVALKEYTEKAPGASHLRVLMTFCPFKDMEVADRLADGLLKAGLKGQPSRYYKIYEENRMTGKGLRELVLGTDSTKWWIEGDMLCLKKWKWLSGCYPVFRNPEGTPEGKDEYLLMSGTGPFPFSTIRRLKEEAVETPDMKWIKWASDADGFGKDGIFTRKNPPAFSFEYPADFKKRKLFLGTIFYICSPDGLPCMGFRVLKITGDVNESLQGFVENHKKTLGELGTDIKIIYNKPLPPDTYGEDYPAYEYEIEWKYQGYVEFTTYFNVIAKEGYLISVFYTFSRAVDRAEAEAEAKAILKTIDLKP